jgi:hypothetical protein
MKWVNAWVIPEVKSKSESSFYTEEKTIFVDTSLKYLRSVGTSGKTQYSRIHRTFSGVYRRTAWFDSMVELENENFANIRQTLSNDKQKILENLTFEIPLLHT